ncbi:MliC family protein [Paracoccus sp. Z118]|uniref:MliC family protein n=1 Tax=Paracoccus sp. Z118 TaxID=2851017 RepID=UPI001C2C1008|nr:MliC family protein [Paracoccus sp. Z118]MBV0891308.1 MliC family protein [Paracoccus sp. Z118]
MKSLLPAALLLSALAAPTLAETTSAEPAPVAAQDQILSVTYVCPDSETLDAVFLNTAAGNSYAVLRLGEELLPMQVAISASGARYTAILPDDDRVFWTKGDTANLFAGPNGDETLLADCMAQN